MSPFQGRVTPRSVLPSVPDPPLNPCRINTKGKHQGAHDRDPRETDTGHGRQARQMPDMGWAECLGKILFPIKDTPEAPAAFDPGVGFGAAGKNPADSMKPN